MGGRLEGVSVLHLNAMRPFPAQRCLRLAFYLLFALWAQPLSAQRDDRREVLLLPGDLLSVQIVGEKELTGQFLVDDRGMVVLPLLGARSVTWAPWSQVRDSLFAAYARELRIPSVQVTPLRRVTVLGHVNLAGMHMVDPHVTLAGAIAMAQGASPDGDLRRIRVVRDGRTLVDGPALETSVSRLGIRSGDEIFVGRRGWWDRNSGTVVGALISAVALLVTVTR
jgi:protein involved in polysaccharide export with SLBB domain